MTTRFNVGDTVTCNGYMYEITGVKTDDCQTYHYSVRCVSEYSFDDDICTCIEMVAEDRMALVDSHAVGGIDKIIIEFCKDNLRVHDDWTGTYVETKDKYGSVEEFATMLSDYLRDKVLLK